MRIDRIELYHVAMPLKSPWRTAYGEDSAIESVLCRMVSGSLDAWGEASPLAAPCYSPDWAGGLFAVARDWFAPALIRQSIATGEDLQQRLILFKGNRMAKGLFDAAWWCLESKITGAPLHELLGGTRDLIPVGADFGVTDTIEELIEDIGRAVARKFRRIKLKFRPGWDRTMLQEVRRAFPNAVIHIDCNSGYRLEDLDLFRWIDELGLAMIEQPLRHDDIIDHAALQRELKTPVCLDESAIGIDHLRQAISLKSCRYMNLKPGRVGGLTIARDMHDLCKAAEIPCWVGGMLESAVGVGHCIALATLDNFTYPADIFPSDRFYVEDLADPAIELVDDEEGCPAVRVPDRLPEPVISRLQRLARQSAVIT